MDFQRVHLVDARIALIALNVGHLLLLLLQVAHHFLFQQNLRLQLLLCYFVVVRATQVLLSTPGINIVLNAALVLRNMLIVNNLFFHALDKPLERVKLCLCLHLTKSTHRSFLFFEVRECTVHGALDVLLDQS